LQPAAGQTHPVVEDDSDPIPPLLRKLLADYAATGLPPAYIPKEESMLLTPRASKEDKNEQ
jgi:hypothetical protein